MKKENITIPRKALIGIAPTGAITGVLLSEGDIGPLILFLVGISASVIIGKGFLRVNRVYIT